MGKQLTVKDIQDESLKILLDVHEFCMKHDIKYSVSGGTLLGAVRHKGYIPWDDDVDIYMLRPDYDKFIATYKSDNYVLMSMETDKDYFLPYAHVVDMKYTEMTYNYYPFYRKPCGLKMDVFPIESVSDKAEEYDAQFERCMQLGKKFFYARKAFWKFSWNKSFKYRLQLLIKKIKTLNGRSAFYYCKKIDENARQCPFGSTHYLGLTCVPIPRTKQRFPAEDFTHTVLLDFEGHKVCAMNGYEDVLRVAFGPNYMTPPPPEQRVPIHGMEIFYK